MELGEKMPRQHTAAKCGSQEKIEVMRQRASRGECLYHPNDNKEQIIWHQKSSHRYESGILEIRVSKKSRKMLP